MSKCSRRPKKNQYNDFSITVLWVQWLENHCTVIGKFPEKNYYYLRSKMVIPFLEFEIFWESLFTFLLIQIALWHKLDSSCKKDFTKIMQNDWKVNKLCWLFTQNQCRNNISDKEIDTLLFFPKDFDLKVQISPGRSGRSATIYTPLKS